MKKWIVKQVNLDAARQLTEKTKLSALLTEVLSSRGITDLSMTDALFRPQPLADPYLMADMDKAVELIKTYLYAGEKITVYGDYDCDGITSTVMLYSYLIAQGGDVDWYIPSREDGYGLHLAAVDKLSALGTKLIITVDNGISAVEEAAYILEKGMRLIITDHHQVPEELPAADAVLNPNRPDCGYPFKRLAGCGVVLRLIAALEQDEESVLAQYGDLAAIGTIADIVPLVGENRQIVRLGLGELMNTDKVGLYHLLKRSGLSEERISATALAFTVCPRINAAGRFAHAAKAVELLLCENDELADSKALELCELNTARQKTELAIYDKVNAYIAENPQILSERVMVIVGENWHHGVVGIVSSKILSKYDKPNLILSVQGDEARGSGRSVDGFPLYRLLAACESCLIKYGGHAKAAGFSLKRENIVPFQALVRAFSETHFPVMPVVTVYIDKVLCGADLTVQAVEQLSLLQPYGEANPMPVFLMQNCEILSKKPLKSGKYLSFEVNFDGKARKILDFQSTYDAFPFSAGERVNLLVSLGLNEYNDRVDVSITVKDIRPAAFDENKYIAAVHTYEKLVRGESVDERLCKRVIPTKADMKRVYDLLRGCYTITKIEQLAAQAGINACMLYVILDVMEEFSLIKRDVAQGTVCLVPAKEKADLSKSKWVQRFSAQMQTTVE